MEYHRFNIEKQINVKKFIYIVKRECETSHSRFIIRSAARKQIFLAISVDVFYNEHKDKLPQKDGVQNVKDYS